jgi:hypothetical protein
MNCEAISAIGQVVGAIAVVISLIYLTNEVRNNARATRLASMRSLSEAINQYFRTVAEDGDLAALWFRGIYDFDSIKGADLMRFSSLMDYLFRFTRTCTISTWKDNWTIGWEAFERIMRDINSYPGIQAWWRTRSHWFSQQFGQFIAKRQAEAGPPSLYGETRQK